MGLFLAIAADAAHDNGHHAVILFLKDLAMIMIVAGAVTLLCNLLRQPIVLGYIIAGVVVGPFTPPFEFKIISDMQSVRTMAEIGLIFLMFSLGLHFSLKDLFKVGPTAFCGALMEIALMMFVGYEIGRMFGWTTMESIFLGAMLSVSSTTIIIKALQDLGMTKEKFASMIFGILIVEDILAIAMIAVLTSVAMTGTVESGEMAVTVGKLGVFLAVVLVVGLIAVPRLLRYVARLKSDEMLLITSLALCFGVSLVTVHLGYSVALGAFIIGAIIAEARERARIEELVAPLKDMFSAVFFVAIGMMIDPRVLVEYWVPIVVITIACVVGKVVSCSLGTLIAGNDARTSMRVGMGLAQIGEFSFIIAQLGLTTEATGTFMYPIAVSVSAVTTLLTPYLIRASDPTVNLVARHGPSWIGAPLHAYQMWVSSLGAAKPKDQIRKLIRKWIAQIALNVTLITGVLIGGAFVARFVRRGDEWQLSLPPWTGGTASVVWLVSTLIALPLVIATIRKARAIGMVLAEMSLGKGLTRDNAMAVRILAANVFALFLGVALVIWMLLVSSTMLPPFPVLLAMLALVAIVAAVKWSSFIKVYAKGQIALNETLSRKAEHHVVEQTPKQTILTEAALETVELPEKSVGAGRLIRELELRSRTGASVVGVQRNGANIINPGPDEELRAGDRVVLLGTADQLRIAHDLLIRVK
jgi:CPA2 family monovalent cation:H+ antiporter-2